MGAVLCKGNVADDLHAGLCSLFFLSREKTPMGHAVFVFGAAGAGKTTFCRNLRERAATTRAVRLVNLDPAQQSAGDYDVDICEHITVEEVMEACDFGPNGALFHALEEMCDNIDAMNLHDFEDEFFVFDCPGQIELFLHSDIMTRCIKHVSAFAKVIIVYITDATALLSVERRLLSCLCAAISIGRIWLPVIHILSKVDLLGSEQLERLLERGIEDIEEDVIGSDSETGVEENMSGGENENGGAESADQINHIKKDENSKAIGEVLNGPTENDTHKTDACTNTTKAATAGMPGEQSPELLPIPASRTSPELLKLRQAIMEYLTHTGLVSYMPLDWDNEEMVEAVIYQIDWLLQRFDDVEPVEQPS